MLRREHREGFRLVGKIGSV